MTLSGAGWWHAAKEYDLPPSLSTFPNNASITLNLPQEEKRQPLQVPDYLKLSPSRPVHLPLAPRGANPAPQPIQDVPREAEEP